MMNHHEIQDKFLDYIKQKLAAYKIIEKTRLQYKGRLVNKEIWIRKSLSNKEKCRTLIHEYGHAIHVEFLGADNVNWDADEHAEKVAMEIYPKRVKK